MKTKTISKEMVRNKSEESAQNESQGMQDSTNGILIKESLKGHDTRKMTNESQERQDSLLRKEHLESEDTDYSLSVLEQKDIDWYLEKKLGQFSGENWSAWTNFVGLFEKAAVSK